MGSRTRYRYIFKPWNHVCFVFMPASYDDYKVILLMHRSIKVGYSTDLWTLKRIAEIIEKRFRVSYRPCHVWKVLKSLGWSCQRPESRALQRDEEAIRKWKRYQWPRIKKSPTT